MDWTKIIEFLGVFGISAASITLLVGYLGRKYIDFISTKKLNETNQILIDKTEKLKYELSTKVNEYQNKINKLHTERLEVIKKFYGLLTLFHDKLHFLVVAGQGNEKDIEDTNKLYSEYNDLKIFYKQNKILIDIELSDLINDLLTKMHSALFSFNRVIETTTKTKDDSNTENVQYNYKLKREYWDKAANLIEDETPALLEKLENEFRKILGVINKVP